MDNISIDAVISGANSGQIAVGNNNVQIRGETVVVMPAQRPPHYQRKTGGVRLLPRDIQLLDRADVFQASKQAVADASHIIVFGPSGIGKSALLRRLACDYAGPREVVYIDALGKRKDDLKQFLFGVFHSSEAPIHPTDAQFVEAFQRIEALVLLDEPALSRAELDALVAECPCCIFVVARRDSDAIDLLGEARAFPLSGLPEAEALQLFEQALGRTLGQGEREAARGLCALVGRAPLGLVQSARALTMKGLSIEAALRLARAEGGRMPLQALWEGVLSPRARVLMGMLAPFAGMLLWPSHVRAMWDPSESGFDDALDELSRAGVMNAEGGQLVPRTSAEALLDPATTGRLITHLQSWMTQRAPAELAAESQVLITAAELGLKARVPGAIGFARGLASTLAVTGQHGSWRFVLELLGRHGDLAWAKAQDATARQLSEGAPAVEALHSGAPVQQGVGGSAGLLKPLGLLGASAALGVAAWLVLKPVSPTEPSPDPQHVVGAGAASGTGSVGVPASVDNPSTHVATQADTAPALSISPMRLDFGELALTGRDQSAVRPSKRLELELENSSETPVALELSPPRGAMVKLSDTCSPTLKPGETCKLRVTYAPNGPHRLATELQIGQGAAKTEVALVGKALAPVSEVALDVRTKQVSLTAAKLAPVPVASLSITNQGDHPLDVGGFEVRPTETFEIAQACANKVLKPKDKCSAEISVRPRARGPLSATLSVRENGLKELAPLSLEVQAVGPLLKVPAALDFASVALGGTETKTLTLQNEGEETLHVSAAFEADGKPLPASTATTPATAMFSAARGQPAFSLGSPACSEIGPGASCELPVVLRAAQIGKLLGTLVLTHDGSGESVSPARVRVTSTVVGPRLRASDVRPIARSDRAPLAVPVVVQNADRSPARGLSFALEGDPAFSLGESRATPCGEKLEAAAKCIQAVNYAPRHLGTQRARLVIRATGVEVASTELEGSLHLRATPPRLVLPAHVVSQYQYATITIENPGEDAVTLSAVELADPAGAFQLYDSESCHAGQTLEPGASCLVGVRLTDAEAGVRQAELTLSYAEGKTRIELASELPSPELPTQDVPH